MTPAPMRKSALQLAVAAMAAVAAGTGGWLAWKSGAPGLPVRPVATVQEPAQTQMPKKGGGMPAYAGEGLVPDQELDAWLKRASANPPAVMEEILLLEDADRRYEVADWVLDAWLTDGSGPVLEWAAGYFSRASVPGGEDLLELLTGAAIHEAPESHLGWIRKQLPPPWRELGEKMTAAAWAETNPDTLQIWLEKPEQKTAESFWKEELVLGFISEDPARAMAAADRYFSQEQAWALQEGVLQSWLLQNPPEAEAWVARDGRFASQFQTMRESLEMPPQRPGEAAPPSPGISPLSPRLMPSPAR